MKYTINRSLLLRLLLGVSCAIFLAGCVNLVASSLPIWMVVLWICAVGISACTGERTPGKGEKSYAERASADGVSASSASIGKSEGALGAGLLRGDLNGDGVVNVSDVQCTVLAVLDLTPEEPATDPVCMVDTALTDLNCDELRNVVDVQLVVGMTLGELVGQPGMPEPVDSDSDNVHDECDNCPEVPNTDQVDTDGDNQGDSCEEPCDGTWQTCCIDGEVDQCCCPEGMACNFGWFTSCGDDSCVGMGEECPDDPDPCDGNWESFCTEDGVVEQACCPEGMACNYGQLMTVCDDGSCVNSPDTCEEPCDGTWQTCCVDGNIDQCCCPEGMACNYGMFNDCGEGTCTSFMDECPVDPNQCDGNWETCCIDGEIGQCCCPEGMACNYGMFNDCGEGTCTSFMDECPVDPNQCDGDWESYCTEDGVVEEACCPEGMACNYGQLMTVCDDGSCVNFPDECEEQCDGMWQTCCLDGEIGQCCCPEGAACNYGWFNDCGDGTCTYYGDECSSPKDEKPEDKME